MAILPIRQTKAKMAVHIGFVELFTAVTADGDVSNQVTEEVTMTMHIGFVELCTAVTADGVISNQATSKNDHAYRICRIVHGSYY